MIPIYIAPDPFEKDYKVLWKDKFYTTVPVLVRLQYSKQKMYIHILTSFCNFPLVFGLFGMEECLKSEAFDTRYFFD
jgi:hypothetical protein